MVALRSVVIAFLLILIGGDRLHAQTEQTSKVESIPDTFTVSNGDWGDDMYPGYMFKLGGTPLRGQRPVVVTNTSQHDLTITSISVSNPHFEVGSSVFLPVTIPPSGSRTFGYTFSSDKTGVERTTSYFTSASGVQVCDTLKARIPVRLTIRQIKWSLPFNAVISLGGGISDTQRVEWTGSVFNEAKQEEDGSFSSDNVSDIHKSSCESNQDSINFRLDADHHMLRNITIYSCRIGLNHYQLEIDSLPNDPEFGISAKWVPARSASRLRFSGVTPGGGVGLSEGPALSEAFVEFGQTMPNGAVRVDKQSRAKATYFVDAGQSARLTVDPIPTHNICGIFNTMGQKVLEAKLEKGKPEVLIPSEQLPRGLYYIIIGGTVDRLLVQ